MPNQYIALKKKQKLKNDKYVINYSHSNMLKIIAICSNIHYITKPFFKNRQLINFLSVFDIINRHNLLPQRGLCLNASIVMVRVLYQSWKKLAQCRFLGWQCSETIVQICNGDKDNPLPLGLGVRRLTRQGHPSPQQPTREAKHTPPAFTRPSHDLHSPSCKQVPS